MIRAENSVLGAIHFDSAQGCAIQRGLVDWRKIDFQIATASASRAVVTGMRRSELQIRSP